MRQTLSVSSGCTAYALFHGYHGTFLWDGLGSFRFCRKNHINLLVVDERSHGKSADQIITFGIRECKDVKCWADYAAKRFPEKSLILSGVSMGSASVMMASVLSLPSSVKALICDCGYTAPAEIIKETIRSFHLPVSFCYALLHFGARIFGHFNLSESTALSAVKQTKLPILFIHGDHDSIVPPKCATNFMMPVHPERKTDHYRLPARCQRNG